MEEFEPLKSFGFAIFFGIASGVNFTMPGWESTNTTNNILGIVLGAVAIGFLIHSLSDNGPGLQGVAAALWLLVVVGGTWAFISTADDAPSEGDPCLEHVEDPEGFICIDQSPP